MVVQEQEAMRPVMDAAEEEQAGPSGTHAQARCTLVSFIGLHFYSPCDAFAFASASTSALQVQLLVVAVLSGCAQLSVMSCMQMAGSLQDLL